MIIILDLFAIYYSHLFLRVSCSTKHGRRRWSITGLLDLCLYIFRCVWPQSRLYADQCRRSVVVLGGSVSLWWPVLCLLYVPCGPVSSTAIRTVWSHLDHYSLWPRNLFLHWPSSANIHLGGCSFLHLAHCFCGANCLEFGNIREAKLHRHSLLSLNGSRSTPVPRRASDGSLIDHQLSWPIDHLLTAGPYLRAAISGCATGEALFA